MFAGAADTTTWTVSVPVVSVPRDPTSQPSAILLVVLCYVFGGFATSIWTCCLSGSGQDVVLQCQAARTCIAAREVQVLTLIFSPPMLRLRGYPSVGSRGHFVPLMDVDPRDMERSLPLKTLTASGCLRSACHIYRGIFAVARFRLSGPSSLRSLSPWTHTWPYGPAWRLPFSMSPKRR